MKFSLVLKRAEQLLYRWGEEPIGVVVPFIAFLAVWLPPQMPDMFAGMDAPIWKMQFSARPFLFALASVLLGLSAWFWTRAALAAHHDQGETDYDRIHRKRHGRRRRELECVEWSEEWGPRMALLFSGAITMLPILFAIQAGQFRDGLLGTEMACFILVGLLYIFVLYRTAFRWMRAFNAPAWMSNFRPTRIIADAPFGWPFALLSLASSFGALVFVGVAPEVVAELDAPTAALAALAFAVGPLVIALAIMRGLVQRFIYMVRWMVDRGAPLRLMPGERERVIRFSNVLGVVLLFSWFFSPPWVQDEHVVELTSTEVREPPGADPCAENNGPHICRPDLKAAVRRWVHAHRALTGDSSASTPMIIVAAEGGASRAAVWLLSAMRMLDNKTRGDFGKHVFAISGVSGGSLGAETYARLLRARGRKDGALDWEDEDVRRALAGFATTDLLSATIATYFLNDMFGNLVGPLWHWAGVPDRNAALEGTFRRMWDENQGFAVAGDPGFLTVRYAPLPGSRIPLDLMPHFFLNGTDVGTGKRVITSTIRWTLEDSLFPDSADFIGLVSHDVSMATAVTNSARFPFISPAGRFTVEGPTPAAYQIIDGGYFENYGARTAWELARAIEDLNDDDPTLRVVPVVVVVSNDLDADQPPRAQGGTCRTMLEDISDTGSQVTVSCDDPKPRETCVTPEMAAMTEGLKPQDMTVLPQSMAPIFGLAATRSAHGRDALNILRRDFCRAPASSSSSNDPSVRFIHIALPKPDPSKGEAAPMNWVLNPAACDYMLNKAPWLRFNQDQAQKLATTLNRIEGVAKLRLGEPERPALIDCGH
ncbi:MAG: hypothetical protein GC190_17085 [Alphaproteobacteria bacterium]|nr:hypothetical protein [Alphaproteobacteria bacterium]